ncbi:MAG TPA: hypothetical protein VLA83_11325 [Candidatus Binatia bacterium]|nr:hypothetical protein [Candidatus Binatia bacterium]
MAESKQQIGKGGEIDALVFTMIRYLDSESDYREHLPHIAQSKVTQNNYRANKSEPQTNDIVLLDDIPEYRLNRLWTFTLIGIFLAMVLLGLLRS